MKISGLFYLFCVLGWQVQGHRVASVPKFGAWDETDPTSGEGFTVIFNKVKQERQVASTKLPPVPPPQSVHSNTHKKNQKSSFRSKVCILLRSLISY